MPVEQRTANIRPVFWRGFPVAGGPGCDDDDQTQYGRESARDRRLSSSLEKGAPVSVIDGLPAHILINHFVVVLMPLTAVLAILCAVWPAARQRLVWLVVVLGVATAVATVWTVKSGEWLIDHADQQSAMMDHHAELGDTMGYFAAALLVAVILLAVLHVRGSRQAALTPAVHALIVVVVLAASVASLVQVYRTGDSGARAAWGSFVPSIGG